MEPSGKGGGAARGRNLPGGLQGCAAGGRRDAAVDRALTFHFEWDLEEERRALKEDQKLCRSRAQKYLMETNRRRRAFEERRKQEEEKEQRLREQVLQQRKIKLLEATEKFQRAHLPFSQHNQIVQTKTAFKLEEALEQIKGSVLTPGLCLPSRNKTNFRYRKRMKQMKAQKKELWKQAMDMDMELIPLPLESQVKIKGIIPEKATVFNSALMPAQLFFKTEDGGKYPVIFKHGDDLHQDQLILQIISLMDKLLRKENLDLKLTPYKVLATSTKHGFMQFIQLVPVAEVLATEESIQNFFRKHAPSETGPHGISAEVMDTYVKSCADDTSSSSASRNGSFHQKQISAMVDWDKTIQESSRTNMDSNQLLFQKNLKEMQQLLEKQHLSNLENFHQEVKKTDDSESLSSLDSLEAGEQNGNYTTPSESSLTTQCDCALYNPEKSPTRNNGLLYTAQSTTSKNMHLNNCLRNVDFQNIHNLPIHDLLAKHNVLTPAEHVNNSKEESSASHRSEKKPAEFSNSGKQSLNNAFSFLQNIKEGTSKPSSGTASTLATAPPVFNPSKAWASPDSVPGEGVQDLMQDQSFKMTPQKRTISVQNSSQPIATSIILFPNQGCSTGIPSTADILPKDKNLSMEFLKKNSGKVTETKEENVKYTSDINPGSSLFQDMPDASVLSDVKQQNNKEEEKGNTVETMSLVSDTELNSGTPAQLKTLKYNILERKRARLLTSILKKESKYEPSHFKAVVMNHGISSGTRPVSSIRDSLELAKIKKKCAENEKYNRKLRWCDQINRIIIENNEKCYEKNTSEISSEQLQCVQTTSNAPQTNLSIVAQPSNPMFLKNHQENSHIPKPNVNTEESNKECTSLNMFMSTGSFSAKKAWMVSKDEESNPPVCSNNPEINEVNQLKNKAKITRRLRSVRAQPSFMPKKRTGTTIRPQSAAEANKILKAPGKLVAPHPPSAPLPGNRSGENTASPGCQPPLPSSLQATATSRNDLNERHVLLMDQVLNRNDTENSESSTCRAGLATAIPTAGCSTARYKPWANNTCSANSVETSACQDRSVTCTERRPVNAKNGLHLHHIPAAGKTSTSPQGAHAARAPEGPATGVVPVRRQKQVFDNHENKHRAFSEHRRQSVASKRWKPTHHAQNSLRTVQLSPVQSAFDPVQNMNNTCKSDEVSESTLQFLTAENLASVPAAEDEILAAMESVQPARQPLLLNRPPCLGMSALSIEEQKIFQSLDHLNQRLQNVQEAITTNPSASNVLQLITPLSIQQCVPSPLVNTTTAPQQYQNASASNQLQFYRRY